MRDNETRVRFLCHVSRSREFGLPFISLRMWIFDSLRVRLKQLKKNTYNFLIINTI